MTDFLLELRSEEIPARMQAKARADLARLFIEQLTLAGLAATSIETHATPRRLALIARGLPDVTQAVAEEIKGPRADAPPQALAGFLSKVGLTRDQLVERADAKGNIILFAVIDRPGRATAQVLAEAVPAIVRAFPWPKSMRWGAASASTESPRWVRPLQGIVALFGEEIVPFEIAGITSGAATLGHRFHHPGIITIGSADDYEAKLRACHVILDADERANIIREGARAAASAAGLALVEDEALVAENAGLTEWPVPLLGRFDPAFLEVPREVIQLTMRTNQKYFACTDKEGRLAPAFVCTANIAATDGGVAIVAGNERVLSARLSDAKFFWEQDLHVPLEEQAKKLGDIVFHEKLGTVADKVDRVAKLARWLIEEGIVKPSPLVGEADSPQASGVRGAAASAQPTATPQETRSAADAAGGQREHLAALTERAARLCKADLVTQSVGEFPELQGLLGAHLARAQGEDPQVCDAIRDHYKPVGQGDDAPIAPVTVAVSLADKLDSLAVFFFEEMLPSGSKDPYALRRSALGVLTLVIDGQLRFSLTQAIGRSLSVFVLQKISGEATEAMDFYKEAVAAKSAGERLTVTEIGARALSSRQTPEAVQRDFMEPLLKAAVVLLDFFADRLKVQQREAGVRHDLIDAVFALGGEDDLVRLLARVHALQAFVETPEGRDLLAGYKRAANILKKEGWRPEENASEDREKSLSYTPDPVESSLIAALDSAEPLARAAIEAEDFAGAMAALASLRVPVDAFFENVTVNDPDTAKRAARMALLARVREAVHAVADFSKIEG